MLAYANAINNHLAHTWSLCAAALTTPEPLDHSQDLQHILHRLGMHFEIQEVSVLVRLATFRLPSQ